MDAWAQYIKRVDALHSTDARSQSIVCTPYIASKPWFCSHQRFVFGFALLYSYPQKEIL